MKVSILHATHHPLTTSPPLAAHAAALFSWEMAHVSMGAYLKGSTHLHTRATQDGERTEQGREWGQARTNKRRERERDSSGRRRRTNRGGEEGLIGEEKKD